ncbi:intracellular protein transport protein USO1-like [Dendronephthya gigantea]|uniref:intracellular protein transport protein USO1-like n=1 Tax=Dendronephthya gigantea TaxID=151771 RepID=UPI00106D3A8D|nr:intracellular protein transport protein USO1-like [Dendronephthya gigantea]XP_028405628.1 intracellular protein transport protein USO1-like [Dendronephthya gigantea]
MESRINSEKAEALLKWVNTISCSSLQEVKSLQELSNAQLLMEIVCLVDKDYKVERLNSADENTKWISRVIEYLENFYHQSLSSFVDQNKITSQNTMEIGKVLSLLLCCAVQGENVSECVDKITSLEEYIQFQLKFIIEAVLKGLDNGKIDSVDVTNMLCKSESFRDVQGSSDEYQSSPIIMSPVSLYNSPIKALMASPQMQSRQSQVTISKLYKRLNQFQIKINNLQRVQSDLEHDIEEKRNQIEEQELKIQSLSQEVTKVPVLEDEIESLTRFETELDNVNRENNRLKRLIQELEEYKQQFLKLEKDYADLCVEKQAERDDFEKCIKEVKNKGQEELRCVQILLDDSNKVCDQLRNELRKAFAVEETMKKQLSEQENLFVRKIKKIEQDLADSTSSRDKLCLKSDQDVLRQIAREADLKQCFRDKEAVLQATIDQTQLQNCELNQNVKQLQIDLSREEENKKVLQSSLALSESKLTDTLCKYERLQSDFISLGNESKSSFDKILEEKDCLQDALKNAKANRDLEVVQLQKKNDDLQEQTRCLVHDLNETKQVLLEALSGKEEMQTTIKDFCTQKNTLMDENSLLQKKLEEKESSVLELKQVQNSSSILAANNDALLKENLSLKDNVRELESLKSSVQALESSLRLANEEIESVKKNNSDIKDPTYELEHKMFADANKKPQNQNDIVVENETAQVDNSTEEITELRNALRIANEEKHSLREINSSLESQVAEIEVDLKEYRALQSRSDVLKNELLLLTKENAEMTKGSEFLSGECENLQKMLAVVSKDKRTLQESNSTLKDEIAKLKVHSENYECLQSDLGILKGEKLLMEEENIKLKETIKQTRTPACEFQALCQDINESRKERFAEEKAIPKYMKSSQSKKEAILDKIEFNPGSNSNAVDNSTIETGDHDLLMSKLGEIDKVASEQDKQIPLALTHEGDIAKNKECLVAIAHECEKNQKKTSGNMNSIGEEETIGVDEVPSIDEVKTLEDKIISLEKENLTLKDLQKKSSEDCLNEIAKVEELKKNLAASEAAMDKLNNNNVEHELEMLSVQDKMRKIQEKNIKLTNYIPQVEAQVVDLEKKLSEEEFISKRLAVEVRSLEAQLSHADRQLRQTVERKDEQMTQKNAVNRSMEILANIHKMAPVPEEITSTADENANVTKDFSIADDSLISEGSLMTENEDGHVNTNDGNVQNNVICKQEEVLKRLRRRSAVYSQKNSRKHEINNKRCSTVGTESFVVGQFSNTVAYEPDDYHYEWDRILELKERNSICAPHLRSSYPVETQVRSKEEVEEEDLRLGGCSTTLSRKRLRDNISDSSLFTTTLDTSRCLPRSKSENGFSNILTEKMVAKRILNDNGDKNKALRHSTSFPEQKINDVENVDKNNRRESIAFKVDITPAKKSRMSLRMPRSLAAEKKENVKGKSKMKPSQTSKKFSLHRKQSSGKEDKKALRTKRTNLAV